MPAGCPATPLVKKLGLKEGFRVFLHNPPPSLLKKLIPLPQDLSFKASPNEGPFDFIHFFTSERKELERKFGLLKENLKPNSILWISWPKKAAKKKTDLDENIVREIGLRTDLADVKVCAIDNTWLGLKFVYRVKDR